MKRKKIIIGLFVLMIIGLSTAVYAHLSSKAKAEETRITELDKNNKMIQSYKEKLDSFYSDKEYEQLKDKVVLADAELLHNQLKIMKKEPLSQTSKSELKILVSEGEVTVKMIKLKESLNQLFDVKGVLVKKAPITQLEKQLAELKETKTVFVKEQSQKLEKAKQQQRAVDLATKEVAQLFDGKKVRQDVSRTTYDKARLLINKIKNTEIKTGLLNRINEVNTSLVKKETAERVAIENKEATTALVENEQTVSNQSEGEGSNIKQAPAQSNGSSSSNYTAPAQSNGGSSNNYKAPAQSNGGSSNNYTAPTQSNGSSSNNHKAPSQSNGNNSNKTPSQAKPSENNTSKPSKPSGSNSWTGNQTGSGTITAGGGSGGTGANTWTGGEFNPGDLDW